MTVDMKFVKLVLLGNDLKLEPLISQVGKMKIEVKEVR